MKIFLLLVSLLMPASLWATSNFYKTFDGGVSTRQGTELVQDMNQLCTYFARVQAHLNSMTAQLDQAASGAAVYAIVAQQFNFRDEVTNSVSNDVAQAAYAELLAMMGNTDDAILQGCARFRQ